MRFAATATVSLVLVWSVAASPINNEAADEKIPVVREFKEGDECPAKFFKSDCNYCSCGEDGTSAACTKMACPPVDIKERIVAVENEIPVIYDYQQGQKCPAQTFRLDCNTCVCAKDGLSAACTLLACPSIHEKIDANEEENIPVIYEFNEGDKCPAKFFKLDCNYCTCGKDGNVASCTLKPCPPRNLREKRDAEVNKEDKEENLPVIHEFKEGDKCPAQRFKLDCNYCWCGKDGTTAACTLMAC